MLVQAAEPAYAVAYQVGVRPGDWWQYGDVTGYCQNPCPIPDFASTLNIVRAITRVTSVTGTNVSLTFTIDYYNGSRTATSYSGDLSTGLGNLPDGAALIGANLNPGDPIFNSPYAPILNTTTQTPSAGALRQANIWNNTHYLPAGRSGYSAIYFDKSTGIVLENKLVLQGASISDRVTGTSLWPYRVAIRDDTFCAPTDQLCKFDPANITIDQGTTVEWNNTGTLLHTVTSCSGINFLSLGCPLGANLQSLPSFDSGPIYSGFTFSSVFNVPGNYSYYCVIHPWLQGKIQVRSNASVGTVGVSAGQWARYSVSDTWSSSPPIPPLQPFFSYANISSIKMQITSTSGNNATASLTTSYQNGTVQATTVTGNVLDGRPPLDPWIIAAGAASHFNYTADRVYAGGIRLVGVLNVTSVSGAATARAVLVWDNATGLLLEETVSVQGGYGASGTISGLLHIMIVQTNAWTPVQPPTVTISSGPNPASTGEPVTLYFTIQSSAAFLHVTIDWGDGTIIHPDPSLIIIPNPSVTHVYTSAEFSQSHTYTISVNATSVYGQSIATIPEVVNDRAPILTITSLSPDSAKTGQTVALNFTATDPDGSIQTTWIDWGDGSVPDLIFNMTSSSMCQRVNPSLNSNACTLALGDLLFSQPQDPSTIVNGSIIIFKPNAQYPSYLVAHRVVKIIQPSDSIYHQITFWTEGDANGVQDGWDQTNGGIPASQVVGVYQYTLPPPSSPPARYDTHSYPSLADSPSKTFTIRVNATDDAGLTTSQTQSEMIVDRAPVLSTHIPIPASAIIGQTVTISFSATDPDGRIASFSVNWGDGSPPDTLLASATSDTHSYDRAGTFTITVLASDNNGSSSDVSDIPFTVAAPASAAPTILGLAPTEFYISIGIVAAMMVAATLLAFRRMMKR